MAHDKDPNNDIEDVFLVVKLKHEGSQVEFADDLENLIKQELIRVIDEVYRCTLNFPRPENTIARGSKT